jgi:hypothetical protein
MYKCTADNSDPVLLREKQNWAKSGTGLWVETPLYPPPAAQPAPEFECPRCGHCCPQRQWVGLTGDEREQIYQEHYPDSLATTITAVENKLKEKNT